MPKLFLTIISLCIIYSGCVIPTYSGRLTLNEKEVKKSDVRITDLLLVGAGSTASRLFLENLSAEMIKLFARYHVQCDFTYAGKIPRGSRINFNNLITSRYDAYLVLSPIDTSYMNTFKSEAVIASPIPGSYGALGSVIGNQYKENYYIELYSNNNLLNRIWEAELKVDFDVANPGRYQKIAKEIFTRLLKHGLISKNKNNTNVN